MTKDEIKNLIKDCLVEEGYISKVTMGLKIKPHQDIVETLKKHEYPGYLNFVKKCNKLDDLEYIKKDFNTGLKMFITIRDRIEKCNKLGKCDETSRYFDGINKKYISKGITEKDCELTIKWFSETFKPALIDKIKELKNK